MPSTGTYKDSKGKTLHRILFTAPNGTRKTIWLGKISKRDLDSVKTRVESLLSAQISGHVPDEDTARWVTKLSKPMAKKLAGVGLIQSRASIGKPLTIGQFCDEFIAGRPDVKPGTVTCYKQAKAKLVGFFGDSKKVLAVTELDADRFRSWMKGVQKLAENSCRTHIKNAKLIFGAALRGKLIELNPFAGHKTMVTANVDRMEFITCDTIQRVIDACPNDRWRAIVVLCRFGGLRCPSEVLTLRWSDIDWDRDRFRVDSPKTGVRQVPLFPEVRKALEVLMCGPNPAEYVIDSPQRGIETNLRTTFQKIITKAKVEPWAKLFQNLRSSRETELAQIHPIHVVVAWLGNSIKVANTHYLQVRESDFERALKNSTQDSTAGVCSPRKSSADLNITISDKPLEIMANA